MSKTLKLEISVADLGQNGVVVSEFATTDYVANELSKKANLNAEGKVDPSLLPDYTYVDGLVDKLDDVEQSYLNSDTEILNAAKLYSDNKISENNSKKADLVEGKVPFEQLPFSMNFEQNVSTEFENVRQELRQNSESIVSQMEGLVGSANSYTDGKVLEEREFLNNTINEYKGEVNSQLNIFGNEVDDILKSGASLPYDPDLEYIEGALTLKDGEIQQLVDGVWMTFKKTVDASDVVDESGETQQEINDFVKHIEVSPELFGYKSGDATQPFIDAAMYAKENNVPFVAKDPNGYLITESIDFYTDTEISKIVMPADAVFRTLAVKTQKATTTVAVSSLSGLTEFSNKVTGFPLTAVGKYVRITSTDILTERNNAPSNTPYNKNTAFRLIDSSGAISPSLDMSFDAGTTAQVSIIPAETRIKVKIGKLETTGTGLNNNSIIIERDSVDFYIDDVSGSTGFRTLLTLTGNDCNFYSPVIKDAQYTGLGYGISIGICCDTNIYSMKGSNCRTTLDGRHGANVTVHNSRLETAGTHWGNNYIFKDCDIDIVTWSGKDLKLQGGSLRNYISMRVDAAMSIGKCEIDGTTLYSETSIITPSGTIIADFFTSPRRVFDSVIVRNVDCTGNVASFYGYGALIVFSADYIPPKNFLFENIRAPKSDRLRLAQLNLANALAFSEVGVFRANNIQAKVVIPFTARGFSKYPSSHGYDVRAVDCGRTYIQCDANAFSKYKLIDSTLVGANRINNSVARGDMIFDDCVIEHDAALATSGLFYIEARKGFIGCEYRGVFSNGGGVNGVTMYSLAARAANGATGFPVPLTNHINRTLYQRDELSFSFDPPSILANGNIRQEFDVPGVQLGDSVLASFNIYNAAIKVSGSVSATNKVSVLFENISGAAVDLATGLVKIKTPA